jgi:TonB family protein
MPIREQIGMKLTNRLFYFLLPIILFCNFVEADSVLGPNTKSLVANALDQEQKKFKECISGEGLIGKDQINTRCTPKDLKKYYEILHQVQDTDLTLFLEGFAAPKSLKKPRVKYPKKAQQKGITGFAIVSYDLDESGRTSNHKIIPPLSHSIFHNEALNAAKKLQYKPLTYQGEPAAYPNMKQKFTFILVSGTVDLGPAAGMFNRITQLLKAKKYTKAEKLAYEKLEKDPFFYYQLALSQFALKKYEEAASSASEFFNQQDAQDLKLPEYYFISHASLIYAESLYKVNKFEELIKVENMLENLSPSVNYENDILWTKIYLGVAFVNTDRMLDGIYYLNSVKLSAIKNEDDGMIKIVDSILLNIENALN